jgi:hypothetical protein
MHFFLVSSEKFGIRSFCVVLMIGEHGLKVHHTRHQRREAYACKIVKWKFECIYLLISYSMNLTAMLSCNTKHPAAIKFIENRELPLHGYWIYWWCVTASVGDHQVCQLCSASHQIQETSANSQHARPRGHQELASACAAAFETLIATRVAHCTRG